MIFRKAMDYRLSFKPWLQLYKAMFYGEAVDTDTINTSTVGLGIIQEKCN